MSVSSFALCDLPLSSQPPSSQQVERIADKQQSHKKKETRMFTLFQTFVPSVGSLGWGLSFHFLLATLTTNLFPSAAMPNSLLSLH